MDVKTRMRLVRVVGLVLLTLLVMSSDRGRIEEVYKLSAFTSSRFLQKASGEIWKNLPSEIVVSAQKGKFLVVNSSSLNPRPLLVVLENKGFYNPESYPFFLWCVENDWILVQPDSGCSSSEIEAFITGESVSSEQKPVLDSSRFYLSASGKSCKLGFELLERNPELWTAAIFWNPQIDPYSIQFSRTSAGDARVLVLHGINDGNSSVAASMVLINRLANHEFFKNQEIEYVKIMGHLPDNLVHKVKSTEFSEAGREILLWRGRDNAELLVFSGTDEIIYNAGLLWLSRQVY